MQSDLFYCKVTLHVSGVIAPIIKSTKKQPSVPVIISVQLLPSNAVRSVASSWNFIQFLTYCRTMFIHTDTHTHTHTRIYIYIYFLFLKIGSGSFDGKH